MLSYYIRKKTSACPQGGYIIGKMCAVIVVAVFVSTVLSTSANAGSRKTPQRMKALSQAAQPEGAHSSTERKPWGDVLSWCNQAIQILENASVQARPWLFRGQYLKAKSILIQGLVAANQAGFNNPQNSPVTARAIERGVTLASKIDAAVGDNELGVKTTAYFLSRYYSFVLRTAREFDLPIYIPYYGGCGSCAIDEYVFEQRMIQFAREQVELVIDTLSEQQGGIVYPLGNPKAFLIALQVSAGAAAQDLRFSLWGARYACVISQLEWVSSQLADYLRGAGLAYANDIDAVNLSALQARQAIDSISVGYGCMQRGQGTWSHPRR